MIFNLLSRPDEKRIKEIGPDKACAEWLLRCGGHVRWKDSNRFTTDYNKLGVTPGSRVIEEVNADNTGINVMGFKHFGKILTAVSLIVKLSLKPVNLQ